MSIVGGLGSACVGVPMGTAITYQGRFTNGGSPADGVYDFEFRLFDASTTGNQVGDPVTKGDLTVTDGYFTTALDFGAGAFSGEARWLQIAVRPGAQTGAYTTLTPRHELTPTPYTLYSAVPGTANYVPKFTSSGLTDSVLYESGGKLGVGTLSPGKRLDVGGDLRIRGDTATVNFYRATSPVDIAYLKYDHANSSFDIAANNKSITFLNQLNWVETMRLTASGSVGIGTTSPQNTLHINSDTANNVARFESTDPAALILLKDNNTTCTGEAVCRIGDDLDLRSNDMARVWVKGATGYMGVGTGTPQVMLEVAGDIRCVDLTETSDEQLKTDVQPLGGVLSRLEQVRAVSFQWNEKARSLGAGTSARQIGVLAQELEQVFPELVRMPEPTTLEELLRSYPEEALTPQVRQRLQNDADRTQYKAVSYSKLTVVLLEAVKELQAQNRALEQRLRALEGPAR
jgi:hypothetical protein